MEEEQHYEEESSYQGNEFFNPLLAKAGSSIGRSLARQFPGSKNEETENAEEGQLTVDVFQDEENIYIQSTIAGIDENDLDVSITNDMVTIKGTRKKTAHVASDQYFYREIFWGNFSRSIILPEQIDADSAVAEFKNGVLLIKLPKKAALGERKLKIKKA
ncbi:MAG: Hsp20/alpha crystallin family protein [Patescibacteria group bacterium]|nr:Hsp20/alpha crystallin family protein [Patescibacteria group bacterium]MDE2438012.1 Hsp20/alpha crystallin family protein [Patescibacteria group bacterium]